MLERVFSERICKKPTTRSLSKGAPHHFPKAHALRYGHRKFGDDHACIFAEKGAPYQVASESSFSGTGWGAKGDFIRYSYLYPYIFESRTHTFFESTCPELYAQQSWAPDQMHIRGEMTSGKLSLSGFVSSRPGVLRVIWRWFFWHHTACIFEGGPPPFSESTCPQVWAQKVWGLIKCIFAENGPLEGGVESSFSGTGWGAKGDFRWIFDTHPCIFEGGPPPFSESTCPQVLCTESLGTIKCIFAENGPLEGGVESSFSGTGWGAKGVFRWIFDPNPFIFERGPPPFSESTCPQVWAQKVWGRSDVYSRRMGP